MHLERVRISGFKSYAQESVIDDLDRNFNAITGLNGSGKSNVLDAICFVLGVNSLSLVRAARMDDLIYKKGHSKVLKASARYSYDKLIRQVSITFAADEMASKALPSRFNVANSVTVTREVRLRAEKIIWKIYPGGKTKYLINGLGAKQGQVAEFFHMCHLNIQNPHFLIMQGRTSKIIQMNPRELLSVIEESSGTKLYHVKRSGALKVLQQKEERVIMRGSVKLQLFEIERVINDEILPAVERLSLER